MSTDQPYGAPVPVPSYASWLQRVGAALLDGLLLAPFTVLGALLGGAGMLAAAIVCYLGAVALWVWNSVVRQGRTGWSIGKRVVGIRLLIGSTAQPPGSWTAFARNLAHVLDALPCYLGYLWPLWDARRQTFADKLVDSVVVAHAEPSRTSAG
jgi:uncharacterized RDD family membrane protein YckC